MCAYAAYAWGVYRTRWVSLPWRPWREGREWRPGGVVYDDVNMHALWWAISWVYLITLLIKVGGLNMEDFHGAICFIAPAMLYITNETFTKVPAIALQPFCWSTKTSNGRTIITVCGAHVTSIYSNSQRFSVCMMEEGCLQNSTNKIRVLLACAVAVSGTPAALDINHS